ncbi:unnamed protein product [Sphagnum jensenii]|uniref:Uncharacterized protein n=1 Tax=Sphagnum jensenii TaxID=128206 RepID=A0ABP1BB88_9BRYO
MEVEAGLLRYAVLCVRMGKMTPSEAKLFVKSASRSNPPRQGKRIAWIGSSESEWESIFAEAEKLRDDDKVDREANIRKKEVMRRLVIVVGGILLLVLILTPATYSYFPFAFSMYGFFLIGISQETPTALEEDFKILEKKYGRF